MIVAIDGPAGAGKSTVARILAQRLGFSYLDTGAMYRAVTVQVLHEKVAVEDAAGVERIARKCVIEFCPAGAVLLNKRDVTEEIRQPLISASISPVAANPAVRQILVAQQQRLGKTGDFVVEGRDTTTVVFPQAECKFYLDADVRTRAVRRQQELAAKGTTIGVDEIEKDVRRRDQADLTRSVGPLKRAADSRVIDTTDLTIGQVVDALYEILRKEGFTTHGKHRAHT